MPHNYRHLMKGISCVRNLYVRWATKWPVQAEIFGVKDNGAEKETHLVAVMRCRFISHN